MNSNDIPSLKQCCICNLPVYCKCNDELNIKPKYKTCAMNDIDYPQAMINHVGAEIHLCSVNCNDLYKPTALYK